MQLLRMSHHIRARLHESPRTIAELLDALEDAAADERTMYRWLLRLRQAGLVDIDGTRRRHARGPAAYVWRWTGPT